jgi:hypothetical protein
MRLIFLPNSIVKNLKSLSILFILKSETTVNDNKYQAINQVAG